MISDHEVAVRALRHQWEDNCDWTKLSQVNALARYASAAARRPAEGLASSASGSSLVAAEHQGARRLVHVQADDNQQLVFETRIARELEGSAT